MTMKEVRVGGAVASLGKPLGRGGEGDVFALADRAQMAVKLYKETLRSSREAKVRAMVEGRLAGHSSLVAFPAAVATDARGTFAGFTMRMVSGYRPIHQLYSPKSRKLDFPKATFRFLVHVARNVARAVATVHDTGCVIGDFNHSGVLISQDGTVALIDADSFQFSLNGRVFPCVVGTEDFTPPELHGLKLASVERTRAHDNFGLAVAIFQLLAMGKHPYMGTQVSLPDLSLGEAIAKNLFAYSIQRSKATGTRPPPGSVHLSDFPPTISAAFEAAFGLKPEARPNPAAWESLLGDLERNLRQCGKISTHLFPHAAGSCIWCRLTSQSGVEMFPGVITTDSGGIDSAFDIKQIAASIRAVVLPQPEGILPQLPADLGPPSQAVEATNRGRGMRTVQGIAAILLGLLGFAAIPQAFILWLALGGIGLARFAGLKPDASALTRTFQDLDQRAHQLSEAHLRRIGYVELAGRRAEMEAMVVQYERLDSDLANELARIASSQEARQKHAYLDTVFISRAKIAGIGQVKTNALIAFGVETAADVTYKAVRNVPGFGEALTQKLMNWRVDQERKFRFSSTPKPEDIQAEQAARKAVADARCALQTKLSAGLTVLQHAPATISSRTTVADPALREALVERARLARDLRSLGITVPASTQVVMPTPKPNVGPAVRFPPVAGTAPSAPPPHRYTPRPTPTNTAKTPSCPTCSSQMVRVKAKKGPNAGNFFWSCIHFPTCRGARN